jgi:antitoxin (DNA-binding transcriptional repressor) of toxin-antitoxin stability system
MEADMTVVNMHEAKTTLSRLVGKLERGEEKEIIIARDGKPVARLTAEPPKVDVSRRIGLLEGKMKAPLDIDADNDAIAELFGVKP